MPPRERQKLQPRTPDVLGNVADRYYRAGNVEGMKRIGQELQDRLQNMPALQPGTGFLQPGRPEEGRGGFSNLEKAGWSRRWSLLLW